jgi:hypothetical protein
MIKNHKNIDNTSISGIKVVIPYDYLVVDIDCLKSMTQHL